MCSHAPSHGAALPLPNTLSHKNSNYPKGIKMWKECEYFVFCAGIRIFSISRYSPLSEDKSENLRNIVQGQRPILSNKSQRTQSEDFYLTKLVWGLELYFLNLKILSEDKWAIYFIHHKSIELFFWSDRTLFQINSALGQNSK